MSLIICDFQSIILFNFAFQGVLTISRFTAITCFINLLELDSTVSTTGLFIIIKRPFQLFINYLFVVITGFMFIILFIKIFTQSFEL